MNLESAQTLSLMIWLGTLNTKARPVWCSLPCNGHSDWNCPLWPSGAQPYIQSVPVTPPLPTTIDNRVSSHSQWGPNTSLEEVLKVRTGTLLDFKKKIISCKVLCKVSMLSWWVFHDHPAPLARDASVSRNILRGRLDFSEPSRSKKSKFCGYTESHEKKKWIKTHANEVKFCLRH